MVKSGRLLLLQDFKISVLETASAIFHIQIASLEKPDIFLTDPFCSKMISSYFRACQNNNWGHMEWEQFQVSTDLLKTKPNKTVRSANS